MIYPGLAGCRKSMIFFADALRKRGCDVYYYNQLLEDILKDKSVKQELISELSSFYRY